MSTGLIINDLHVGYKTGTVLHGVALKVPRGGCVALLGTNGAGKTTLLKTISGLLRPRVGSMAFDGESLVGLKPQEIVRRRVIHVPEGRRVFAGLTIEENLKVASHGQRDGGFLARRDRVYDVFPALRKKVDSAAGLLSGGQQQMLAVGRAIIANPRLLLLDEMSLGLAPRLVEEFYANLSDLFDSDVAILAVEQNANVALKYCSDVYVMRSGNIVAEGPADTFRDDPVALEDAYLGTS